MNAVCYYRYSSANQTEQSIEGQQRVCLEYAKRNGYNVIHEYVDRAISGMSDNRPEFQQMVKDSRFKDFQAVIVYKYDRFARNRYDSVVYKKQLETNGVKVISAMEAISDDEGGRTVEAIYEVWAEWYSKDLSQKAKRGLRLSAEKGQTTGGNTLYGYKVQDKKIVIDEDTAPAVRVAFEKYADGVSSKDIAEYLNSQGYKRQSLKPFTGGRVGQMLRQTKYMGIRIYRGEPMPGYPAIVAEELFNKVQAKLELKKRTPATAKADVEYILTGKLYCGHCGKSMAGISGTARNGSKHYYYVCSGRYKLKKCNKAYEKKDFIEWYIVEQAVQWVLSPAYRDKIIDKILKVFENDITAQKVSEYKKRLAKIEREIDKCFNLLLNATVPAMIERANKLAEDLEVQKLDTSAELTKLELMSRVRHSRDDISEWLNKFTVGDEMDIEYRKQIVQLFVHSVWLYDDKVVIYFNVGNDKEISFIDVATDVESEFVFDTSSSAIKTEIRTPFFVCINGKFGIVVKRN